MSQLIKHTEEIGSRARENRRWLQGRVLALNRLLFTARVDVGSSLADGTVQYLEDVPYTPQNPPSVGDMVALEYSSTSNHSVRIGPGRLSGQNPTSSITVYGGVSSLAKYGATKLTGDVTLSGTTPVELTQTGQDVNIHIPDAAIADAKLTTPYIKADGTRAFTGDQSAGSHKLTSLADASSTNDAVNLGQLNAVSAGLDWKASCRVASTANITLSGTQTIDGVAVAAGERVLVKDQTTSSQNGIYACASGAWSRATDADTSAEVTGGMAVFITEGTANGDKGWVLTTNDPITLGTTALTFTQFSGSGGTLSDHNHTSTSGDGGVLTNDEHDGFAEFAAISAPSNPASGKIRVYPKTSSGVTRLYYRDSAGIEIALDHSSLGAVVPANSSPYTYDVRNISFNLLISTTPGTYVLDDLTAAFNNANFVVCMRNATTSDISVSRSGSDHIIDDLGTSQTSITIPANSHQWFMADPDNNLWYTIGSM